MSDLKRLGMHVCDVLSGSNVRCVCVGRRANVGNDRERVGRKKQIKEERKKRQK